MTYAIAAAVDSNQPRRRRNPVHDANKKAASKGGFSGSNKTLVT
jgi:hypothetical protein